MGHNKWLCLWAFLFVDGTGKRTEQEPHSFSLEIHFTDNLIVEPLCLLFAFKEDAHPRMEHIVRKMVDHKSVVFYLHFLNLTVRNRAIPIQNKLAAEVNSVIELVKVLHHTAKFGVKLRTQFFST
jgi:hypothetical protein